jgi:hypothetical protein
MIKRILKINNKWMKGSYEPILGFIRLSCPFRLRKNNLRVRHENKKELF